MVIVDYSTIMCINSYLFSLCYYIADDVLVVVQNKLKTAYNHLCNSDNPHCYVQLALVRDKICNIHDKKLNEITRHTLKGQVDEILKIKEPLERGLEDIFHYNDLSCPRLVLIVGAPGKNIYIVIMQHS